MKPNFPHHDGPLDFPSTCSRVSARWIAGFLRLLVLLLAAPALQAATNTVTVCDLAHLQTALASGGTVNFGCDATIILTNTLSSTLGS